MGNTDFDKTQYETVIISALLHDIGKFYQRSGQKLEQEDEFWVSECCKKIKTSYGDRYSYKHAVYSGKFVRQYLKDYEDAEIITMYHHLPENVSDPTNRYLTKLIALADWLSSGERRDRELDEEVGDPYKEPLISIFSTISLNGKKPQEYYVPVAPLDATLESNFPVSDKLDAVSEIFQSKKSYRFLWNEFTSEFQNITPIDSIEQLLFVLEKYTICIPSATYKERPDLSLFHHSKSAAAIAACLYRLGISEEKVDQIMDAMRRGEIDSDLMKHPAFLFVAGDISGIQDFIYSVTSEKALKGLRGRSFYIQLLSEIIARRILSEFNMPAPNLIYLGGGHFYILLPFIDTFTKQLLEIEKEVDKVLLKSHNGKLSAVIGYVEVRWCDFMDFRTSWDQVAHINAKKKKRKFSSLLCDDGGISILGPYELGGELKACEICGEEIEDENQCPLCFSFSDLSNRLARGKSLSLEPVKIVQLKEKPTSWLEIFEALGFSCRFMDKEDQKSFVLNSTDFAGKYLGYKFIARTTPIRGDEIITLEEIADEAKGIKKWGILRADVDNLGLIFRQGLGGNRTISRMSMLSFMISLYFSARIDTILKKGKFKDRAYVVYSGGDDLFIIGAWSDLPKISEMIYEDFRKFTCWNPSITMSGGIYIAPSKKFPVYRGAELAGIAVDIAKNAGKNRLTLLDTPIPWNEFSKVREISERIESLLEDYGNKSVPRSLLSTLYSGWQEKELAKRKVIPMPRIWRLFYAFKKLMRGYKEGDAQLENLNELLKNVTTDYELMPYLDVATRWADYLTRKEG
ncbi:MAG: type III-A CRISPR-associated protein Cas10/Csm1 [Deltaproteobacteria bacterium]|nr:type III-A CRISPR-associated protein Cas10/Csm1 [Deltaproteobacteria bacterium]